MGTISISKPSDGQTIDAADVNTPLDTIVAVINGNLDDDNIKTGANINGTKILANSLPPTAYDANARGGWNSGILPAPNTITYNGNRNYSVVFNTTDLTSYISNGMRLRFTRTVAAPTQCTSLNGTTQYYSKSSPNKLTFTDDFVVSAWVKLASYGATSTIASRFDGTSGWDMGITTSGTIFARGFNAGAANFSRVDSYQSVPLNKWVHITMQLDMSAFTATTTTSYVMFDGVDVPSQVTRGGTNPTALVQAGTLQIGASNTVNFFPGKLAQVAIYSAKVAQATIAASISQTLSGSETSLASAYSLSGGVITDLNTTTPNDLTANGSAVATNADSPFANAQTAGSLEYGEVFNASFSTNTTLVVQVPDGCAIPTSGGVSAVAYSSQANPYGWPGPITVLGYALVQASATTTATSSAQVPGLSCTAYIPANRKVRITFKGGQSLSTSAAAGQNFYTDVWEGTVGSGTAFARTLSFNSGANWQHPCDVVSGAYAPSSSGSKTFNAGFAVSSGTLTINSSSTAPAYLMVELI